MCWGRLMALSKETRLYTLVLLNHSGNKEREKHYYTYTGVIGPEVESGEITYWWISCWIYRRPPTWCKTRRSKISVGSWAWARPSRCCILFSRPSRRRRTDNHPVWLRDHRRRGRRWTINDCCCAASTSRPRRPPACSRAKGVARRRRKRRPVRVDPAEKKVAPCVGARRTAGDGDGELERRDAARQRIDRDGKRAKRAESPTTDVQDYAITTRRRQWCTVRSNNNSNNDSDDKKRGKKK